MKDAMMRVPRKLLCTCALGIAALQCTPALAQNFVNNVNTHRTWYDETVTVKSGDVGGFAGVLVEKVPDNQHLILTDVVMTHNINTTTNTFRANIRRGPASNPVDCDTAGLVLGPYVSPDETVSINLTTGIEFGPGEQICVVIGGAGTPDEGVTFSFTGYLTNPVTGP